MNALDDMVAISQLSHFQPSHGIEIAKAYRHKSWTEKVKEEIVEWIERCAIPDGDIVSFRVLDQDYKREGGGHPQGEYSLECIIRKNREQQIAGGP